MRTEVGKRFGRYSSRSLDGACSDAAYGLEAAGFTAPTLKKTGELEHMVLYRCSPDWAWADPDEVVRRLETAWADNGALTDEAHLLTVEDTLYDLLFKWFLDMPIDAKAFDATTFTKNRKRLLEHEVADRFFAAVVDQARLRSYLSLEHFSVDGTLLEAWASHKSLKPKDGRKDPPAAGRNAEVSFHGQRRSNETHVSTTDPEARLARKSNGTPARMCFAGHLLMENRNALIVDAELTLASGFAEREAAIEMLGRLPKMARRRTVAADKGYDTARVRRPSPEPRLHAACGPAHQRPALRHRRQNDSASRAPGQSTDPALGSRNRSAG